MDGTPGNNPYAFPCSPSPEARPAERFAKETEDKRKDQAEQDAVISRHSGKKRTVKARTST